ncbi:hypothetical protein [Oleiharenicola lentus]|jgi:hypothetical protein|uniref:hypothetical protein n=1 Tax=Oleiharenicola lentus TaxID=2508720 RepID=UPI0015D4564C|nr:hypothetical protein [Oleiharenicola lentus]
MELNLHAIATKCYVSGRDFAENDRVVSYLVREASGEVARRDLLESEDPSSPGSAEANGPRWMPPAFIFCRWVVAFKPRRGDENSERNLKLTAENLFLNLAIPSGATSETIDDSSQGINTPLLQFLALMMERKRLIKPIGLTEDGARQIYEHRASHQRYEVPVGDLNQEFFMKIQEHLGVLVGTPKPKAAPATEAAPAAAATQKVPADSTA